MKFRPSSNVEGPSTITHMPIALGESDEHPPPTGWRHPASALRRLPPTYVAITAKQDTRAVEALAGPSATPTGTTPTERPEERERAGLGQPLHTSGLLDTVVASRSPLGFRHSPEDREDPMATK